MVFILGVISEMRFPARTHPAFLFLLILQLFGLTSFAQTGPAAAVSKVFLPGTRVYGNISYAGDSSRFHLLDIYLPEGPAKRRPLVIWVHGGAWMLNDKYADMGYMKNTIRGFLDSGYALASIDYRYSSSAPFPAQIRDCNQAVEFLYRHAVDYQLDSSKIALIGFSAGGHLATLLGLSLNNNVPAFFSGGEKPHFSIRCVLDFYGPADFLMLAGATDTAINNARNPAALLLGAMGVDRPDLAKTASPVSYIDKNDPPVFIVQGEKDESVPNTQSKILASWLRLAGVKTELIIVPGAPHYGPMFDTPEIRNKLSLFLSSCFR